MRISIRTYDPKVACVFRSTKARFGALSNMAAGYPLQVGAAHARTAEALYQACRFPARPDVQEAILSEASPMAAKAISRTHEAFTRADWPHVRVSVMRWCLSIKLAQHFDAFGRLLETTGELPIVESSSRDDFWGAIPDGNGALVGRNALGRLLMELRAQYASEQRYELLLVEPMPVAMLLLEVPVPPVDARDAFLAYLDSRWRRHPLTHKVPSTLSLPLR